MLNLCQTLFSDKLIFENDAFNICCSLYCCQMVMDNKGESSKLLSAQDLVYIIKFFT